MFSIYGETGRVFKGAMEDIWRIDAVRRAARTRAVSSRTVSGDTAAPATPPAPTPPHLSAGVRGALAAYAHSGAEPPARHPLTHVRDVMSARPFTLPMETNVMVAWRQLTEHGVGQAPVVDADGTLRGLLSRADLLQPDRLPGPDSNPLVWRALLMQPVTSVMWTPIPAAHADTDLRRVARVLIDTHLPGLPVVDEDGRVSGFVSRTDILRAVVHDPPLDLWT